MMHTTATDRRRPITIVFILLLSVLTSCASAIAPAAQPIPATWQQQWDAARVYMAVRDPHALLTQVKMDRSLDAPRGDFRTLHVRFHFVSPSRSHWITLEDTDVAGTIKERGGSTDGKRMTATYQQRLHHMLQMIQLSPADVVQRTLPEAQRRGFTELKHQPDIDLRLRLDRVPVQWSIVYTRDWEGAHQSLSFDVHAETGQILDQWTYPKNLQ